MARWLVQLWSDGNPAAVSEFVRLFSAGDPLVLDEQPLPLLSSAELDQARDASHAMQIAQRLVDEVHGVLSILQPSAPKPKLNGYFYENDAGERTGAIPLEAHFRCALEVVPNPQHVQLLLASVRQKMSLRTALALFSLEPKSWGRLYRIIEEVECAFHNDLPGSGLCASGKLRLFKRCCQSADVAGSDSRHRAELVPAPDDPMSHKDAVEFVRDVLRAALNHLSGRSKAGAVL